jgi:hypothetical protein
LSLIGSAAAAGGASTSASKRSRAMTLIIEFSLPAARRRLVGLFRTFRIGAEAIIVPRPAYEDVNI